MCTFLFWFSLTENWLQCNLAHGRLWRSGHLDDHKEIISVAVAEGKCNKSPLFINHQNNSVIMMEAVVIVAIGILAFLFATSFVGLMLLCKHRYCRMIDLTVREAVAQRWEKMAYFCYIVEVLPENKFDKYAQFGRNHTFMTIDTR